MRPHTLPTAKELSDTIDKIHGTLMSLSSSSLGEHAEALLRQRWEARRINAKTFELYTIELLSLVAWVSTQVIAWGTVQGDAAVEAWVLASASSTQRRLRAMLVCDLSGDEPVRRKATTAYGRQSSSSADLQPLTLDLLKHVHRRAVDILERVRSQAEGHSVTEAWLCRAALIAMCRYGAARASDLVTLAVGDLQTDEVDRWQTSRAKRHRGRSGVERVTLPYPPEARESVERYLAYRTAHGVGATEATALVFRRPGGGERLLRPDMHRLVAGLFPGLRLPNESSWRDASSGARHVERCILDLPPTSSAASAEGDVKISPSLLWHCAATDIVSRYPTFSPHDMQMVHLALRCHPRRVTDRYREVLEASGSWSVDAPYRRPELRERAA